MDKTNEKYNAYIQILKEELIPAMGCTEPIALAYAAAVARKVLGQLPERVDIGRKRKHYQECKVSNRTKYRSLKGNSGSCNCRYHCR